MKTITINERSRDKLLHIEAPGCIINIHVGLTDSEGRAVTRIDVKSDRYAGEPAWWVENQEGNSGMAIRVVRAV